MRRTRLAPAAPALALALALTGCISQPEEANNNEPQAEPTRSEGIVQEPQVIATPS